MTIEYINPVASVSLHNDLVITAQISILHDKQPIHCRALLDIGSSMDFIKGKGNFGSNWSPHTLTTISKLYITITPTSIDGTYEHTLTFPIIPTISTLNPTQPIDRSTLNIPRNLRLADPRFYLPVPIDVLLSSGINICVDVCRTYQFNAAGQVRTASAKSAIRMGHRNLTSQTATNTFHASTMALQADLARFWEIDEGPPIKHISDTDRRCDEHFRAHIRRTSEERYIVALSFNDQLQSLGSSKTLAMKRLASLNRRFQRNKRFESEYRAIL